jgi:hypothetical protein
MRATKSSLKQNSKEPEKASTQMPITVVYIDYNTKGSELGRCGFFLASFLRHGETVTAALNAAGYAVQKQESICILITL